MSFTTEVKSQIAANELHPCCMKAELTAVLQMCSTMNFTSEGMHLTVKTENANTAKRVFRFLKELYQVDTQLGAFLAGGSVNSPSKSNYHLEISTQNVDLAKFIWKLMQRFDLPAKQIRRRNQEVVYLKASDKISDFLRCVGASDAVFTFEDSRIQRDFMNSLTRLDNCDRDLSHPGQPSGKASACRICQKTAAGSQPERAV